MALLRGAALVAGALVLAGCGLGAEEGSDEITADQLAIMVLPQEELESAAGFPLDESDSGPVSAREAADASVDPKDGPGDMRRAGWTDGYELNYTSSDAGAMLATSDGLFSAGSSVDLFDTETSARAFLLSEIRGYERFLGKERDGVRLLRFETFDVDVGDEGWGVEFSARGNATVHATGVFFRSGRLVASAGYLRADEATMREAAVKAARALEARIAGVLSGDLDAEPVPLPSSEPEVTEAQLSKMTLGLQDLPAGAFVTGEGRIRDADAARYFRNFDVEQTLIGRSHLMLLRSEAQVYDTKGAAQLTMRYISSPKGRGKFARAVIQGFRKAGGAKPRNVRVAPLPAGGADSMGIVVTFDLPAGRFRVATVVVRSGRAVAIVSGFCTAKAVHPGDMPPLGERARARLASLPV